MGNVLMQIFEVRQKDNQCHGKVALVGNGMASLLIILSISMWKVLAAATQHHFSGLSSNQTMMIKITPHTTDNGCIGYNLYITYVSMYWQCDDHNPRKYIFSR